MAARRTAFICQLLALLAMQAFRLGVDARIATENRRRHASICSPTHGIHCHAKVLLAAEYNGAAPVGAAALKLAYRPDAAVIGNYNQPGPAAGGRRMLASSSPPYSPQQLQQVYLAGRPATKCQTIAIVGVQGYPTAQAHLDFYRSYFDLGALTVAMFDQDGHTLQTSDPSGVGYVESDPVWAMEQMLDLSMASAICPCCPMMYVGAKDASPSSLQAAIYTAVAKGASVVSMSWGGGEAADDAADKSAFGFPGASGVAFTASSGDSGYAGGMNYPASSAYVTAVGGTTLYLDSSSNRASETTWSGAGSGCSAFISKPSWQTDTGCSKRMVADVSAVADPYTGVLVYFDNNWMVAGGTSVGAPIIGAMYAGGYLGQGNWSVPAQGLYPGGQDHQSLFDVMTGSSGSCGSYLCNAAAGYDGPTGNGSPDFQSDVSNGSSVSQFPTQNPPRQGGLLRQDSHSSRTCGSSSPLLLSLLVVIVVLVFGQQ